MQKVFLFFLIALYFLGIQNVPESQASVSLPGTITTDQVYPKGEYRVSGHPAVIKPGATVTFEAGSVIRFVGKTRLDVQGVLNIGSTEGEPTVLTTSNSNPQPGSWGQIRFVGGKGNFENLRVEYSGSSGSGPVGGIEVIGGELSMKRVEITKHASQAFILRSGQATLEDLTFDTRGFENISPAVLVENGELDMRDARTYGYSNIIQCGRMGWGIYRPKLKIVDTDFSDQESTKPSSITIYNTCNIEAENVKWSQVKGSHIALSGVVTGDMSLPASGLPIKMVTRADAFEVSGKLVIPAGAVLKFGRYAGMKITGTLDAQGTKESPIIFTSLKDDVPGGDTNGDEDVSKPLVGDWDGLRLLGANSQDSVITNANFYYGGEGFFTLPYNRGVIYADKGAKGRFLDGIFKDIKIKCASAQEEGVIEFVNTDFSSCALALESKNIDTYIEAQDSYWGDPTGPLHKLNNPEGLGREVIGLVKFEPWANSLSKPVESEPESGGGEQEHDPESATPNPKSLNNTAPPTNRPVVRPNPVSESSSLIDPVIIVPGLLGSWPKYKGLAGELELDPIFRSYDDLLNTLRLNGYKDGKNLFKFPYQWRQSNEITWRQLKAKIDQVKNVCKCAKVDIVAHSMGGLVSRAYIQSDEYRNDVDQVIFLGTPHHGAPKAYLIWEGAEFGGNTTSIFLKNLILKEAVRSGYLTNVLSTTRGQVRYIQERIKSIGELLPVYSYLRDYYSKKYFPYSPCKSLIYPCNSFLEKIDHGEQGLYQRVRVQNFTSSTSSSTPTALDVQQVSEGGLWAHGKPTSVITGSGDETVPSSSASLLFGNVSVTSVNHSDMPRVLRKQIVQSLLKKEEVEVSRDLSKIERLLLIDKFSPISLEVIDPNGRVIGVTVESQPDEVYYSGPGEDEFMVIANPLDGMYEVRAHGTGKGSYVVRSIVINNDFEISQSVSASALAGSVDSFNLNVSKNGLTFSNNDLNGDSSPETTLAVEEPQANGPMQVDDGLMSQAESALVATTQLTVADPHVLGAIDINSVVSTNHKIDAFLLLLGMLILGVTYKIFKVKKQKC